MQYLRLLIELLHGFIHDLEGIRYGPAGWEGGALGGQYAVIEGTIH
jgi:hypothetical protein